MPAQLGIGQISAQLKPGMTVFVPGLSGESSSFYEALRTEPTSANGVRFVGVLFPGINKSNFLNLSPSVRQRAYFMTPGLRQGLLDGRVEILPIDYPGIHRD